MKKISMLFAALCSGAVFGAELPDFAKAETWKEATWTKSTYSVADGVMSIERTAAQGDGSGAWRTIAFPVTAGDKLSGSFDVHFISKEGSGHGRTGIDFCDAKGKRVQFYNCSDIRKLNSGFEPVKFECKPAPEGAVKAMIFLCLDGYGKIEYRNVKINQ